MQYNDAHDVNTNNETHHNVSYFLPLPFADLLKPVDDFFKGVVPAYKNKRELRNGHFELAVTCKEKNANSVGG